MIDWKEMLLLVEGQVVDLPSPKNHICFKTDVPIFATAKLKIVCTGKVNLPNDRETEMMDVRWKFFDFTHQIPEKNLFLMLIFKFTC